ncbi:MAG: hypothetical protein HY921_11870 [Elusimicrobia bacterium]|nr:hypothetical protein [Elusimicrobiota bacterium]
MGLNHQKIVVRDWSSRKPKTPSNTRRPPRTPLAEEPRRALGRAVALAPQDSEAWLARGQAHFKLGHYKAASLLDPSLSAFYETALLLHHEVSSRDGASETSGKAPGTAALPASRLFFWFNLAQSGSERGGAWLAILALILALLLLALTKLSNRPKGPGI